MKKEGKIITPNDEPHIYSWLSENVYYYKEEQRHYTLTSDNKINAYCNITLNKSVKDLPYPFGYVKGLLDYNNCKNLTSFKNSPEKVELFFCCNYCDNLKSFIGLPKYIRGELYFYNNMISSYPSHKKEYYKYIDVWIELLESVSEDDKWEYINNYKNRKGFYSQQPIIPKEVINKYKIDFLLK